MYAGSNTWRPQVPVSVIFELIQPQIEQAPITEKQIVLPVFFCKLMLDIPTQWI
jgi:hypothetical protein